MIPMLTLLVRRRYLSDMVIKLILYARAWARHPEPTLAISVFSRAQPEAEE
eukprot:SAG25_NODE_463_length_7790_cov_6.841654_3_plen_51_part_00